MPYYLIPEEEVKSTQTTTDKSDFDRPDRYDSSLKEPLSTADRYEKERSPYNIYNTSKNYSKYASYNPPEFSLQSIYSNIGTSTKEPVSSPYSPLMYPNRRTNSESNTVRIPRAQIISPDTSTEQQAQDTTSEPIKDDSTRITSTTVKEGTKEPISSYQSIGSPLPTKEYSAFEKEKETVDVTKDYSARMRIDTGSGTVSPQHEQQSSSSVDEPKSSNEKTLVSEKEIFQNYRLRQLMNRDPERTSVTALSVSDLVSIIRHIMNSQNL